MLDLALKVALEIARRDVVRREREVRYRCERFVREWCRLDASEREAILARLRFEAARGGSSDALLS